jgi:hypothetical protein
MSLSLSPCHHLCDAGLIRFGKGSQMALNTRTMSYYERRFQRYVHLFSIVIVCMVKYVFKYEFDSRAIPFATSVNGGPFMTDVSEGSRVVQLLSLHFTAFRQTVDLSPNLDGRCPSNSIRDVARANRRDLGARTLGKTRHCLYLRVQS